MFDACSEIAAASTRNRPLASATMDLSLLELRDRPAAYIHPERFRPCVPDLPPALADQVLATARLQQKVSALIVEHHRLEMCDDADLAAPALRAAAWPVDQLMKLAPFAGGVWHARSLQRLILRPALAALSGFDTSLRAVAIGNMDLAAEKPDLAGATLAEAIRRDGTACLNAWIGALPAAIRSRVVLKFPARAALDGAISEPHRVPGVAIIQRLATLICDGAPS